MNTRACMQLVHAHYAFEHCIQSVFKHRQHHVRSIWTPNFYSEILLRRCPSQCSPGSQTTDRVEAGWLAGCCRHGHRGREGRKEGRKAEAAPAWRDVLVSGEGEGGRESAS